MHHGENDAEIFKETRLLLAEVPVHYKKVEKLIPSGLYYKFHDLWRNSTTKVNSRRLMGLLLMVTRLLPSKIRDNFRPKNNLMATAALKIYMDYSRVKVAPTPASKNIWTTSD